MVREAIGTCCVQSLQMNDARLKNTCIKHFVREHLGCTCPDEVFENITVTEQSDIFSSANTVYEIGGRLFVAVIVPGDCNDMSIQLGKLVVDGMQFRDQHGYNRFRLVIVTDDDDAEKGLQRIFNDLPGIDNKTHLHVIKSNILTLIC